MKLAVPEKFLGTYIKNFNDGHAQKEIVNG
jgi:hypothetical protein